MSKAGISRAYLRPDVAALVALVAAMSLGVAGSTLATGAIHDNGTAQAIEAPAEAAQLVDLWATDPGWQVVQDHPVDPDLLVFGIFGQPYLDPHAFPPPRAGAAKRKSSTAGMPRLALRCENGVTGATILRPTRIPSSRLPPPTGPDPRRVASAAETEAEGLLVLAFTPEERIDIDLRGYRANEPIYLPEPYDIIGRLRRVETLYYFEISRGEAVAFSYAEQSWGAYPDAVFSLEGLDELLHQRRDPCGWRAS